MRRHERKRGAKVTDHADPEGSSPEITALDMADSLFLLAGNSCHSGKASCGKHPGILVRIELYTEFMP